MDNEPLTKAQQQLVLDHLTIAWRIAASFYRKAPHVLELDELIQTANMGLVKGAKRAHLQPEGSLENYMAKKARGAILDQLRVDDHVPRSARELEAKLRDVDDSASDEEKADYAGVSLNDLRKRMRWLAEKPVGIESVAAPTVASAESAMLGQTMANFIESLETIQQVVLALHYVENREIREISVILKISESRASTIHTEAVLAVFEHMKEKMHASD